MKMTNNKTVNHIRSQNINGTRFCVRQILTEPYSICGCAERHLCHTCMLLLCAGLFLSAAGDLHVKKEVPARAECNPGLCVRIKTKCVFTPSAGDAGRIIKCASPTETRWQVKICRVEYNGRKRKAISRAWKTTSPLTLKISLCHGMKCRA